LVFVVGRLGALLPGQRDRRRGNLKLRLGFGFVERLDIDINLRRCFVTELVELRMDKLLRVLGSLSNCSEDKNALI